MSAMGRQHGRCPADPQGKMLAPRNGGIRLCRHWGANSGDRQRRLRAKCWRLVTEIHGFAGNGTPTRPAAGPHSRAKCWRLATEAQGFAGNGAPTRPTVGYRPALGGKFPAGALKAEKENGRGHSPFPLSHNRKLPAGRRKLTNCYSYAVYRSSRYLYRSSASFMYCDAPENIFDKLNR